MDKSQKQYKVRWLDCSILSPKLAGEISSSYGVHDQRMCCVNDMVVITNYLDGTFAYNTGSGELKWRVEGKLEGMGEKLVAWSVTADGRGHLFVGDQHNACMLQIFGVFFMDKRW